MISNLVAQWLLAGTFIATFSYAATWLVRASTVRDRVGYGLHAVMSAAMFAMIWPWGIEFLLVPQIVIFAAGTIWFLARLSAEYRTDRKSATLSGHHDGAKTLGYHATMMAAMVLMAAGMTTMSTTGSTGSQASDTASMPGMDMAISAGDAMTMSPWVTTTAAIAAIGFAIATLYYLGSTLAAATADDRASRGGRIRLGNAAWNLLMAIGMATLFVPLTGI